MNPFERSSYPLKIKQVSKHQREIALELPGVRPHGRSGIQFTVDASVGLANLRVLKSPLAPHFSKDPELDLETVEKLPYWRETVKTEAWKKARPYQREDSVWLATRDYALNSNGMRTGKSFEAILAALLKAGPNQKLVLCPSFAKPVWCREVYKWTGIQPLVLYGQGANKARYWHPHCYRDRYIYSEDKKGPRSDPRILINELNQAEWIVCSYEILKQHRSRTEAGKVYLRKDLPGWANELQKLKFLVAIIDESHYLRSRSKKDHIVTRSDLVRDICKSIQSVYALTGTPVFAFTRDLQTQLDIISGGLWGNGKPWTFDARYCEGRMEDIPTDEVDGMYWENKGLSNEDELNARLKYFTVCRDRSVILPYLPKKFRQIHLLDTSVPKRNSDVKVKAADQMRETFKKKIDDILEHVANEVIQKEKVVLFVALIDNFNLAVDKWKKLQKSKKWSAAFRRAKLQSWAIKGGNPEGTARACDAFVAHQGGALTVATIRSLQGANSLKGASSVHYADLDYDPGALFQSEERVFEEGLSKISIHYWIVPGSYDDRAAQIVLPKLKQLAKAANDRNATELATLLKKEKPKETLQEIALRQFGDVDLSMFEGED